MRQNRILVVTGAWYSQDLAARIAAAMLQVRDAVVQVTQSIEHYAGLRADTFNFDDLGTRLYRGPVQPVACECAQKFYCERTEASKRACNVLRHFTQAQHAARCYSGAQPRPAWLPRPLQLEYG